MDILLLAEPFSAPLVMKFVLSILLIGLFNFSVAQYKPKVVLQEQHFYINSATHLGGKSQVALPVTLPANTVAWYYTYTAYRDAKSIDAVKGRMTLVTDLATSLAGIAPGATPLVHQVVGALTAPPGGNHCHVYLLDRSGLDAFNKGGLFQPWTYYPSASRENFVSGCVPIYASNLQEGELYLGIRNPDSFHGIHVLIAVEAVVSEQPLGMTNTVTRAAKNATIPELNEQLFGRWKDDNSTFTLSANGEMSVKFDNAASWISGRWAAQGDQLFMTLGVESTTYRILSIGTNRLSYQDVKSGIRFSAQRFAE